MTEFTANTAFSQQINQILQLPSPLQKLNDVAFDEKGLKVYVKRDDLIHPEISGNKWRKLKYNLLNAKDLGYESILTFGGAYSNHIYATAAAGKYFGFETIGIIRGDELNENSSQTLKFAAECGMKLHFASRSDYREMRENPRNHSIILSLNHSFIIPEGGTNELALAGVGEMVDELSEQLGYAPDYIICPVGTGGTISGIIAKSNHKTTVLGICVLKNGHYLENEINVLIKNAGKVNPPMELPASVNFEILWDFHHGGYAKKTPQLMKFIEAFEEKHSFQIEPIYSGKMFFAFDELIKMGIYTETNAGRQFHWGFNLASVNPIKSNSTVVLIHTGGLQSFNS